MWKWVGAWLSHISGKGFQVVAYIIYDFQERLTCGSWKYFVTYATSCDPWSHQVYFVPKMIYRLPPFPWASQRVQELLLLIIICRRTDFSQSARDISFLNVSLPMISGDTLIRYQNDKLNIFAFQLCAISPDSSVQWWQEQENLRDEARICSFALLNFATHSKSLQMQMFRMILLSYLLGVASHYRLWIHQYFWQGW